MNLIFVRSPYMISVDETGQTGAKVKLYIWNNDMTEPTEPTYTLSKDIPSTTQLELSFNISNYVREYIDNIIPISERSAIDQESYKMLTNVKVKRYKTISGVDTLLDTTSYIASNGFTKYEDGLNYESNLGVIALADESKVIYYDRSKPYPYINLLFDNNSDTESIKVKYTPLTGAIVSYDFDTIGLFNYTIPITLDLARFDDNSLLTIIDNNTSLKLFTFTVKPICEPKYTPVVCSYINRKGGWQFLTFFKAQTNTINTKGSTYRMMPSASNYNPSQAQTKSFNINGQQSIKLNTGWVDENYSDLITDLLLSETILLDGKPVELKTTSTDLKTSLKDKMINYEIEFDCAFNLINDVV
jgi:hypothetical protein